ncbi:MAG: hypothetical protein ABJA82_04565 [Myxococcales bacterium]
MEVLAVWYPQATLVAAAVQPAPVAVPVVRQGQAWRLVEAQRTGRRMAAGQISAPMTTAAGMGAAMTYAIPIVYGAWSPTLR